MHKTGKIMKNQKSDTRKFFETMWIMVKYDVLPWMLGAGLVAAVIIGAQDVKSQNNKKQIEKVLKIKSDTLNIQNSR